MPVAALRGSSPKQVRVPLWQAGPRGLRGDQQGVVVAVERDVDDVERVAGGFAFFPQTLLAAAEEHRAPARQRLFERFAIHVRQHEHGAGVGVLHDGGHQAIAFGEIDACDIERQCSQAHLDARRRRAWS